jgi:bifunctional DNA-binding transcriptional regulator/antitoxin component of YhaV-PrlF toxin-antitoxin module
MTTHARLYTSAKAMPKISSKNQVTLPVEALAAAGLKAGDEVMIAADGPDAIVVRRKPRFEEGFGVFHGLYPPGHLRQMREEDWP